MYFILLCLVSGLCTVRTQCAELFKSGVETYNLYHSPIEIALRVETKTLKQNETVFSIWTRLWACGQNVGTVQKGKR